MDVLHKQSSKLHKRLFLSKILEVTWRKSARSGLPNRCCCDGAGPRLCRRRGASAEDELVVNGDEETEAEGILGNNVAVGVVLSRIGRCFI